MMNNETILKSRIPPSEEGKELIEFLCGRFRYHSRVQWIDIIMDQRVTVNGEASTPGFRLKNKDSVEFRVLLNEPPVDRNIRIVHEEETFLVASKPGSLPSHADGNFIKNTFIFIINEMLKSSGFTGKAGLVHRLDRETSGLMIVSKNTDLLRAFMKQFQDGTVKKEYTAVVRGIVEKEIFTVSGSIVKDTDSSISIRRKLVPGDGFSAGYSETRFEVIERLKSSTAVRCVPVTGRTNQIRVHLAHSGYPLVGDKLYGRSDDEFLAFVNNARAGNYETLPWLETKRHMLHAGRLEISHPLSGERMTFIDPVPDDMSNYGLEQSMNLPLSFMR
jgi:RluA family pseudouridine synthase